MSEWKHSTAAEIARYLDAEITGDAAREVRGVAPLDQADAHELSWLGDKRYVKQLSETRAGVVLAPPGIEAPEQCTLITVGDPDLALCRVLELIGPRTPRLPAGVHPTAVVDPTARIEATAAIGPHVTIEAGAVIEAGAQLHAGVYVGADVVIGSDSTLWPGVVLRERTKIGQRVIIHPNSTIGADGYGYLQRAGRHVKIPQVGCVVIEDEVEIGANCTIDRARSGETRIRRGTKIDNIVHIAHNCDVGEGCIILAQSAISGSTRLESGVLLGGQAGVADHVKIGAGAVVTSASGVTSNLAPGGVYRGTPAADRHKYERQQAAVRRLPEALKQLRELAKRVEQLESATADNRERN